MRHKLDTNRGFTLIEMLVSMAIGMIVIGSAVQLLSQALKATWVTSQKAELQQDFRAATNIMARDIGMAGAGALGNMGLSTQAVLLPEGTGINSVYPCNTVTCNYINGAPVAYPLESGARYLYSIIPGYNFGITVNAAQGPTDIISVSYVDSRLALNCYVGTYTNNISITFTLPAVLPTTCILPTGVAAPQPLNDPIVGLQPGDMILFGQVFVGVVSTIAPGAGPNSYVVTFQNGISDPGHINQPAATSGNLAQFAATPVPTAARLLMITYYLDISPSDGVTPRLMRVQNGKTPTPVAENVAYLKFSYDLYNNGTISANQTSLPAGTNPGMITKVNILHMTIRSQMQGVSGYQGLDLQTSVSTRDMTFQQEYPIN
jgi:prepilin-type N-terminal cleavage/methylation domain-containing protein